MGCLLGFSVVVVDFENSLGIPDSSPSSVIHVVNILHFSVFLESWKERFTFRGLNLSDFTSFVCFKNFPTLQS